MSSNIYCEQDENQFRFPFQPYPSQIKFMQAAFNAMSSRGIALLESPTGTGKSLSLICACMLWLVKKRKCLISDQKTVADDGHDDNNRRNDVDKNVCVDSDSEELDWIRDFRAHQNDTPTKSLTILWFQQAEKRYQLCLTQIEKQRQASTKRRRKPVRIYSVKNTSMHAKFSGDNLNESLGMGICENSVDPLGFFDLPMLQHDTRKRALMLDCGEDFNFDEDFDSKTTQQDDDDADRLEKDLIYDQDMPTIFYCSRTHSQLSQFVEEYKRTAYAAEMFSVVPMGSRKQMCINSNVNSLKSSTIITDKCSELLETKSFSEKKVKTLDGKNATSKSRGDCGCPYYSQDGIKHLRNIALSTINDIEDIVERGIQLDTCPYYGAREAIKAGADIVVLPYTNILHAPTRESLGIRLSENSIIVFDEAHNVIDAINDMYSARISMKDVQHLYECLCIYESRYKERLSSKNLYQIQQLLLFLKRVKDYVSTSSEKTQILQIHDFLLSTKNDAMNVFDLDSFIKESQIIRKLLGFSQFLLNSSDEGDSKSLSTAYISKRSSLHGVANFISCLTTKIGDGRVILLQEDGTNEKIIKFSNLDPSAYFTELSNKVGTIIMAGGTLSPKTHIIDRLLGKIPKESIIDFSCGHIVPRENVLPLVMSKGPTGVTMDFTYNSRMASVTIEELGRVIWNVVNIVPKGIVLFFPSYSYEEEVCKTWEKARLFERILTKKKIFRERKGQPSEELLLKYHEAIKSGEANGALLSAVVGGKLSEGINFSDDHGRAVVVIGMPFPNPHDPETKEVVNFIRSSLGESAASNYLEDVAMKAVNQSIGRVVRHARDYASILLLDKRYEAPNVQRKLPSWIKDNLQIKSSYGANIGTIAKFFAGKRMQLP